MSNLRKISIASFILIIEQSSKKLVGLVSTLILARLLIPEDFGIIAIALLVTGLIDILSTTGSEDYLLRVEKLTDEIINTAWTINFTLKSFVSIIMFAAGFFAAEYYSDPRLVHVISSYALICFIYSLKNPGLAYLRYNQEYNKIVSLTLLSKIFSVTATIIAAFTLRNYWALVIGTFFSAIITTGGSYFIYNYKLKFEIKNFKDQVSFSGWLLPQAIFGYIKSQIDTFLVSSTFGQTELGSYHTIKYISHIPNQTLLSPFTKPFLVELSKVKNNKIEFIKQYNVTFLATLILVVPITTLTYYNHELITSVLLGRNWVDFSYILGIFSLMIPAYAIFEHAGRVLLIHGKTRSIFLFQILSFAFVLISIYYFGLKDLKDFALARVIAELFFSVVIFTMITAKYTSVNNFLYLTLNSSPIFISALISGAFISSVDFDFKSKFILLLISSSTFILFYLIIIILFFISGFNHSEDWKQLNKAILNLIKKNQR